MSRVEIINERLREAAKAGVEMELKAMLNDPECNVYSTDGFGGTALMYAASHGHTECVQLLLSVADAKGKDIYGVTALIYAVSGGHEACVRILLTVSDALAQDNCGTTALMCAAVKGNETCTHLLLPMSDAAAKDKFGMTAVDRARSGNHESLARFIDVYALAQSEQAAMNTPLYHGKPHRKSVPRV